MWYFLGMCLILSTHTKNLKNSSEVNGPLYILAKFAENIHTINIRYKKWQMFKVKKNFNFQSLNLVYEKFDTFQIHSYF